MSRDASWSSWRDRLEGGWFFDGDVLRELDRLCLLPSVLSVDEGVCLCVGSLDDDCLDDDCFLPSSWVRRVSFSDLTCETSLRTVLISSNNSCSVAAAELGSYVPLLLSPVPPACSAGCAAVLVVIGPFCRSTRSDWLSGCVPPLWIGLEGSMLNASFDDRGRW